MARLTNMRRAELAQMDLPDDAEMIRRVKRFVISSGLGRGELGDAIGYSWGTISQYTSGCFGKGLGGTTTLEIRSRLKQYMDLHTPPEAAELAAPFLTDDYVAVRKAMLRALASGRGLQLDGPPGTQKTFILRSVQQEINRSEAGRCVYVYSRQGMPMGSFLQQVCIDAGVPERGGIDQLLRKLHYFLAGRNRRVLLAVDEAQHLPDATLEVLRQLLDMPNVAVVISGSHNVSVRIEHWSKEQWRSRLPKTFLLNGPSEAEAKQLLLQELPGLDVAPLIQASRTESVRYVDGKATTYSYISARALFDAIKDAKERLLAREAKDRMATRKPNVTAKEHAA